jgi:hypothetical protein
VVVFALMSRIDPQWLLLMIYGLRSTCAINSRKQERSVRHNKGPQNNALERTRRVGVPASRAVVRVSPRRSTQCCAGESSSGDYGQRRNS